MELPVNASTFKKSFLGGNGNIAIETEQSSWENILQDPAAPFKEDTETVADLKLGGTTPQLKFGEKDNPGGLKLEARAGGEAFGKIRLFREADKDDALIRGYDIAGDSLSTLLDGQNLYAVVTLGAKADASFNGSAALAGGPLKTTFGIGAGGEVKYERIALFPKSAPAISILNNLLAETRMPQAVNAVAEVPARGEVLALYYSGYLNLSAGLAWGYSLTGTKSATVKEMNIDFDYKLKMMGSIAFGYRLAGSYSIEARRGTDANSVRYIVRKSRESTTNLTADFGFTADYEVTGLPESPDKLIGALLGADAESILGRLHEVEEIKTMDDLKKKVGELGQKLLVERAGDWINAALNDSNVRQFLDAAQKVVEGYRKMDEKVIALYEEHLDNLLNKLPDGDLLDQLSNIKAVADLKKLKDGQVWDVLKKLFRDDFSALLLEQEKINELVAIVAKTRDFKDAARETIDGKVREFIAATKAAFPLGKYIDKLGELDTPEELRTVADEKMKAFIGTLIDKSFDTLKNKEDFEKAFNSLQKAKAALDKFRSVYADTLKQAAKQSFAFNLNLQYKRADKNTALVDVEIDLSKDGGAALAGLASRGDFGSLWEQYKSDVVKINKAVFTHDLTKSTQLQVNVWNWSYKRLVTLMQHAEHSVEAAPGGLMHVYSIDTSSTQIKETEWRNFKEKVRSNFMLSVVGATFQKEGAGDAGKNAARMIETLSRMGVQYDLLHEDERTSADELTEYLSLADYLNLEPHSDMLVADLTTQFPQTKGGLGKVSVNYVVKYSDKAVRGALTKFNFIDEAATKEDREASRAKLERLARDTARQFLVSVLLGKKDNLNPGIAMAYLDEGETVHNKFREIGKNQFVFKGLSIKPPFPAWLRQRGFSESKLGEAQLNKLFWLLSSEEKFVEGLMKLCGAVQKAEAKNKAVSEDDLADAASAFVASSDRLNEVGGTNAFFIIFDKLVQVAGSIEGERESAMILEVTPPDAAASPSGEKTKVVKFLMA